MTTILIIGLVLGFILLHTIKLMRLYLILIDQKNSFERFVPAYLRTTLVNLIIPFKLGEIYRIVVFSRISGEFRIGFFSVLVDRFFDTFAIVLILLPYQLMISGSLTLPVILLSVFLVVILFAYVIYPSAYTFLNRYIIMSKTSSKSMVVLKGLEVINDWYEYVRMLVIGRYGLLILFSVTAWIFEILIIAGFARVTGFEFRVADFGDYIESIVSGASYQLSKAYNQAGILFIGIATVISIATYLIMKNSKNRVSA